jgi:hypothetical protein
MATKKPVLSKIEEIEVTEVAHHLRHKIRELESQVKDYQKTKGHAIEMARTVAEAVKAVSPYPKHSYAPQGKSDAVMGCVMNLSDVHVGEMIRPAETQGFGAFNYEIAERRVFGYVDDVLAWVTMHRRNFDIPNLHIFGIGDYISGDIHKELQVTNEFPLPVQTAKAGILLGEAVRRLAPHFHKVYFEGVGADNHGRLNPKPQCKQKTSNSMSFLVHALIEAYCGNHKNVQFTFAEGMKHLVTVAEHNFLVEHGDTVKAVMGIPYYGLERMAAREARRRMNTEQTYHYQVIGHWHVPAFVSGNIIMNGSVSGTTEFDHSCGRHAAPAQTSFLVNPKHGMFDFTPWTFEVEQEETDRRIK